MRIEEIGIKKAQSTTNFYWYPNKVDNIEDNEGLHVGKYSYEYLFRFESHKSLMLENTQDYRNFLRNGFIYNEEGALVAYDEFWKIVEDSKNDINGHNPYGLKKDDGTFIDGEFFGDYIDEGYTFSTYAFQ